MIFSKEELSNIFKTNVTKGVDDICINSEEAKPGDLFIAFKGDYTDGHEYVKSAFEHGASLALVEQNIEDCSDLIKVPSTYQGLLDLAKYNIQQSKAKFIGVTGSIGKTTTKNLIYHMLSQIFPHKTYVTKKNFNSKIGLPICVACMPRNTIYGIFEMGMSSFGEIKHLISIVPPKVSVITHICETHLEFFNCIWDIAKAKSEIMESSQDATVIPADSAYTDFLKNKAKQLGIANIFSFGFSKSDAQVISYTKKDDSFEITANILGKKVNYRLNCHNDSVISNSLAAILASHVASGLDVQELAAKAETFGNTSRRGDIINLNKITIIDDSYNACYTSVRSAIKSLSGYSGRKILVLGDMKELGKDSRHFHENLAATIDKFGIDLVFTCGELSKYLFKNLSPDKQGGWFENSRSLAKDIISKLQPDDKVLVKGSNSMKMNIIVEAISHAL